MLNSVYHFNGDIQVVDNEEYDKMLASGAWFDCPTKAESYKKELLEMDTNEPKPKKRKAKLEEDSHEK